jgi:hypothetical protein
MWQFESSNVDSVTGLVPSSSIGTLGYTPGKYGQAAFFNQTPGTTPTLSLTYTLPSGITANNCTISFWLKPYFAIPSSSGNQQFVSFVDSQVIYYMGFNSQASTTQPYLYYYNGANNTLLGGNPATQVWYHTVGVLSNVGQTGQNSNWTYYFNGVSVGSFVVNKTGTSPISSLYVGSAGGTGSSSYMAIDDLRVFNTALTAAQVQAIYGTSGMPSRQVLSGTPLFSQLSSGATSSAVGAFSLRAVNGTTTKAVAVQAHPVAAWPPIAFTGGGDFTATGMYNGVTNGVYKSRDSFNPTSSAGPSWVLFDKNDSTYYIGTSASYNTNTGAYLGSNSTTISTVSVLGEWVQLQSPVSFILRNYTITSRPNLTSQAPTTFWIAGSNDGTTWSNVHYQAGITLPPVVGLNITVPQTSNSLPYRYYRLVASVLGNSTDTNFRNVIAFVTWDINGDSPSYAPNAAQDFYADRLGNLLTTPVTGQSLASWLGGATGYVTTWYDQSGRGNHATQATAANQPKIDLVNKQIDFKPSAYFDLPNGTVPFGNSNYTMIVKHNTINATRAGFIGSGTYGTQNATNSLERNSIYINYWWSNDMSGGTYAQGSIISATYDNTIGRTLYVNGASVATNANKNRNSTNIQNTIGTDLRGNQGQSGGNRYLNGELYYVFLFGSALSDTDRTLVESLPI